MITYYASNQTLNRFFGNTSFSVPSTYYIALSTTTINSDGTGITEPVGNGYTRVAVVNSGANFATASNGVTSNVSSFTFPESSGSWGTLTYWAMYDNSTAGNIWFFDTLTPSRAVASLTTVLFVSGAIQILMNNT